MKTIFRTIVIAILLSLPSGMSAQQAIESIIKSLETSNSVTNQVYSERRDEKDSKIKKSNCMFEFNDDKIAEKLIAAIQKDREKASSYNVTKQTEKVVYSISFVNGGMYSKYTLIQRGKSKWMLTANKSPIRKDDNGGKATRKNSRRKSSAKDRSEFNSIQRLQDFDPQNSPLTFNDDFKIVFNGDTINLSGQNEYSYIDTEKLKKLEQLSRLNSLEGLTFDQFNSLEQELESFGIEMKAFESELDKLKKSNESK